MSGDHDSTTRIVRGDDAGADPGIGHAPTVTTGSGMSTPTVRSRRNRSLLVALLAAAGAVIVITATISVVSGSVSESSPDPAAAWTAPTAPAIPAGSHLIRHEPSDVISPITIGGPAPTMNALDWTSTTDSLTVQWDVQGIVQSATTSSDKPPGPPPTVATAGHGYTVDALPRSGSLNTPITAGDHPAVLSTGAPAADSGILANHWISWRLQDGRYVHAWSAGASIDELTTFAGGLVERDQVLPRRIAVTVTLPGLTVETVQHGNDPTTLNLDRATLCPTTQSPQDQSERAIDRCIIVGIGHGDSIDQSIGMMGGDGQTITIDREQIYTAGHSAYLHVDNKNGPFGVNVWSPDPNPQDLALIAASVRFDPAMAAED